MATLIMGVGNRGAEFCWTNCQMTGEHEKSGQYKLFLAKNMTHRTLAPPPPLSKTFLCSC